MKNIVTKSTIRISLALVAMLISILLIGELLGLVPDKSRILLEERRAFAQTVAAQFALAAERQDFMQIKTGLNLLTQTNSEIKSAAIRRSDGTYFAVTGDHDANWGAHEDDDERSFDRIKVSIIQDGHVWGVVELSFYSEFSLLNGKGFTNSFWSMIIYLATVCFIGYLLFLRRVLQHLDPAKVIPERVKRAFDTLTEGILILNEGEQIVMANRAFCNYVGLHVSDLLGRKASELGWSMDDTHKGSQASILPWKSTLKSGIARVNERLKFQFGGVNPHVFSVNCSEILDDANTRKGVLVTFEDITELESKNIELELMIEVNERAMLEISRQNTELKVLAEHDPMTRCYNRRAFHWYCEKLFREAKEQNQNLVCVMLDIDHFKSINDTYGHQTGDLVIKLVADITRENLREKDIVGRYGGEEFCLVLPSITNEIALEIAERLRINVQDSRNYEQIGVKRATISIGLASNQSGLQTPSELINLADKALYFAKRNGRNRVVMWKPELDSEGRNPCIGGVESVNSTQIARLL